MARGVSQESNTAAIEPQSCSTGSSGKGLLVFAPFIVDATVTLIRRILKREKFWHPHKTHYYQRLVELGWGHRRTVLAEYGIMLLASVTVLSLLNEPNGLKGSIVLIAWGILYILLAFAIEKMERARVQ